MLYYLVDPYPRLSHSHIMAEQSKVLIAVDDVMEIPLDADWNGAIGVEYGPVGDNNVASSGTVAFEGTVSGLAWYGLKIVLPDATKVDDFSAVGIGYVDSIGTTRVRARMTVAGGAEGVRIFANQKKG